MPANGIAPAGRTLACVSVSLPRLPWAHATLVVIVVVIAFVVLTVLGIPQSLALAGLAGAGALGVRLAARLAQVSAGGNGV